MSVLWKEEIIYTRVGTTLSQNGPVLMNSAMDWLLLSVKRSQNSIAMACYISPISKEHTIGISFKTQDHFHKDIPRKNSLDVKSVTKRWYLNNKATKQTSSFLFAATTVATTCCSSVQLRSQFIFVFNVQSSRTSSWLRSSFHSCFAVYNL